MASLYEMAQGPNVSLFDSWQEGKQAALNDKFNGFKLADLQRMEQARPLMGQALMGDKGSLASLAGIDPNAYMDVGRFQGDMDKANIANQQKKYEQIRGVLSAAKDQQSWGHAVDFLKAQGADVPPEFADFNNRDFVLAEADKDAAESGLTPIWATDAQGKPALFQLNKGGGAPRQVQFPAGVTPNPGVQFLDLGTGYRPADKKSGVVEPDAPFIPKDLAGAAEATAKGKTQAENVALLDSMEAKLPGLEQVVASLDSLAEKATYTLGGQLLNEGRKQLGMDPSQGAVARTQYQAMVANQVLPLLRDTFGAQFTAAEGERLLATLGNPDATPQEKQAVLKAFIEQKKRDIQGLARQVGRPYPGADGITQQDIGGGFNAGGVNIPNAAVEDLTADPSPAARAEFDAVFGEGASAQILGQ